MNTSKFDLTNWNYAFYATEKQKALISLVALPSESEELNLLYCPTVLSNENEELFQKEFKSLEKAIKFMNSTYSHWDFMEKTSSSGCGSCEAH